MSTFILADNQELTRFALESLLRNNAKAVVYRASDKAGLMQLLKEHEAAVVILDFTLFDFADEDQLLIVGERFAMAAWVLLSDDLTKQFLRKVVYSSHRFSVVFKDELMADIRTAIQSAAEGRRFVSQRATEMILSQQREAEQPALLTSTETEIVKAIAQGKTTREIAAERFSSVHTVTTHRKNIFRKLGINTAHEVVKYALRAGLVDPSEFYI